MNPAGFIRALYAVVLGAALLVVCVVAVLLWFSGHKEPNAWPEIPESACAVLYVRGASDLLGKLHAERSLARLSGYLGAESAAAGYAARFD